MGDSKTVADKTYPDFVALIGQENAPPGGSVTYDFWLSKTPLGEQTRCLDMACSTGLSARIFAKEMGCRVDGIDLSPQAIEVANDLAARGGVSSRVSFQVADASALPYPDKSFDAVIAGSSFGFISERKQALAEVSRVLKSDGKLLVACRHYVETPPTTVLDRVENAISYRPDPARDYAWWQRFFREHFTRCEELQLMLPKSDPERLADDLARSAEDPDHPFARLAENDRAASVERLRQIRTVLVEHDRYQGLSIMVWSA